MNFEFEWFWRHPRRCPQNAEELFFPPHSCQCLKNRKRRKMKYILKLTYSFF